MKDEATAILAHVMWVRDDLEAGRLTSEQAGLYTRLGRKVARLTDMMEATSDPDTAEAIWRQGADIIRDFLAEHFPRPRAH